MDVAVTSVGGGLYLVLWISWYRIVQMITMKKGMLGSLNGWMRNIVDELERERDGDLWKGMEGVGDEQREGGSVMLVSTEDDAWVCV